MHQIPLNSCSGHRTPQIDINGWPWLKQNFWLLGIRPARFQYSDDLNLKIQYPFSHLLLPEFQKVHSKLSHGFFFRTRRPCKQIAVWVAAFFSVHFSFKECFFRFSSEQWRIRARLDWVLRTTYTKTWRKSLQLLWPPSCKRSGPHKGHLVSPGEVWGATFLM